MSSHSHLSPSTIRPADGNDAPAIADLLGQLGYPTTAEEVVGRLDRIQVSSTAIALVAVWDGKVAGLVTAHVFPSIHATPPAAWLTTLVVGDGCQQRGVGRQLTASVEDWSRNHGALRISVASGMHRDAAHAFYEHIGYERTGLRLTKPLAR